MTHKISVLPKPQSLIVGTGNLLLNDQSNITCHGAGALELGKLLAEYMRPSTGFPLPVANDSPVGTIHLEAMEIAQTNEAGFTDETYSLTIDESQAYLKAKNATGLARGIQTLRQLLPAAIMSDTRQEAEWILPSVTIEDAPRFQWRGQHLDVSRHFFTVKEVCKFIDLLALHRLNVCHLHLTDDQGWRIEIKKYPRLTDIGSLRDSTLVGHQLTRPRKYDSTPYGGYYSQEDIKEIVNFAKRRHVTLVPEIDMPGHMSAAISAYPHLGNSKNKIKVRSHWGVSQNTLNLEESTVDFMKDVLDEVMALFPGRYIHVGGDEAPKFEWSECKRAQERMDELDLNSEDELQSWFIRQMNTHITNAGRRLIGWDEIMQGGTAEGATVMAWTQESQGFKAAESGHDTVVAPWKTAYFDHYQMEPIENEPLAIEGLSTLQKVYTYEPIPEGLSEEKKHHILGGQGQLWTEYMPTMQHVEYMGFPRICALSEVLWLDAEKKNYTDFSIRLEKHRNRLKLLGVNAHP